MLETESNRSGSLNDAPESSANWAKGYGGEPIYLNGTSSIPPVSVSDISPNCVLTKNMSLACCKRGVVALLCNGKKRYTPRSRELGYGGRCCGGLQRVHSQSPALQVLPSITEGSGVMREIVVTSQFRRDYKWWLVWVISFLVSLITPAAFHWLRIEDIVEPLRYPWGLLPAELLLLRNLGELSYWIPIILVLLLIWAICNVPTRRASICSGALLTAIYSSLYAAYCLLVVSMYLVAYAQDLQSTKAEPVRRTSTALHASGDTPSLKQALHITENVNAFDIVDQPWGNLKGTPSELFAQRKISRVVVIANGKGLRSIGMPQIAQAWIDIIRWQKPLSPIDKNSPSTVIGCVILDSGELVVIRRSAGQVIIQVGIDGGSLPAEAFPDILGITARLIDPAGDPAQDEPQTEDSLRTPHSQTQP